MYAVIGFALQAMPVGTGIIKYKGVPSNGGPHMF